MHLVNDLLERCYIGDWFVLCLLAQNTTAYMFKRIVKNLAESLRERRISKTATISMDNLAASGVGASGGGVKNGGV